MKKIIISTTIILSSSTIYGSDPVPKINPELAQIIGISEYGRTAIHEIVEFCCKTKDVDFEYIKTGINEMVKLGININAQDKRPTGNFETPLHIAARNGHLPLTSFLLDQHSADPNGRYQPLFGNQRQNAWQKSPLMLACEGNHTPIIKFLLEKGAQTESGYLKQLSSLNSLVAPKSYITPLMEACHKTGNNTEAITYLLLYGADLNQLFVHVYTCRKESTTHFFNHIKTHSILNAAHIIKHINTLSQDKKDALYTFAKNNHRAETKD